MLLRDKSFTHTDTHTDTDTPTRTKTTEGASHACIAQTHRCSLCHAGRPCTSRSEAACCRKRLAACFPVGYLLPAAAAATSGTSAAAAFAEETDHALKHVCATWSITQKAAAEVASRCGSSRSLSFSHSSGPLAEELAAFAREPGSKQLMLLLDKTLQHKLACHLQRFQVILDSVPVVFPDRPDMECQNAHSRHGCVQQQTLLSQVSD